MTLTELSMSNLLNSSDSNSKNWERRTRGCNVGKQLLSSYLGFDYWVCCPLPISVGDLSRCVGSLGAQFPIPLGPWLRFKKKIKNCSSSWSSILIGFFSLTMYIYSAPLFTLLCCWNMGASVDCVEGERSPSTLLEKEPQPLGGEEKDDCS